MVRIKHRYLLVQILYPSNPIPRTNTSSHAPNDAPSTSLLGAPTPTVQLHAPTPDSITVPVLLRLLRTQLTSLFGDYGSGLANATLKVIYFSNATSTFILRCERAVFRLAWAAVTFVRALPEGSNGRGHGAAGAKEKEKEKLCVMQVLRVSGTIRKCEEEAIRRARALCGRVRGLALMAEAGMGGEGVVEVSEDEDDVSGDGMVGDVDMQSDEEAEVD